MTNVSTGDYARHAQTRRLRASPHESTPPEGHVASERSSACTATLRRHSARLRRTLEPSTKGLESELRDDCGSGPATVADLAGELQVNVELVAKLARIVGRGDLHGIIRFNQSAAGWIVFGSIVWPSSVSW